MSFHPVNHPLVKHKLGLLRNTKTNTTLFRQVTRELTNLLTYEATRYMITETKQVEGWAGTVNVQKVSGKKVAVAPILRAGIGMLQGVLDLIPSARVNVIGLYRNEDTAQPIKYYEKFCNDIDQRTTIILDPMLATGGSMIASADMLKEAGCQRIKAIVLVAAPEGVQAMEERHPDIEIWGATLDEKLNDIYYILPGLGDAGDRLFGTK
jgi:uracil phosphoribosyltransferase